MSLGILSLALWSCTGPGTGGSGVDSGGVSSLSLSGAVTGDPALSSVHSLDFAPDGTLAIGDGNSDRIVALELPPGDVTSHRPDIDDVYQLVAEVFGDSSGTSANIRDIAADPRTGRIYLAAERLSTGEPALFRVTDDDTVEVVDLSDVTYSALDYSSDAGVGSLIFSLAWTTDALVAAVTETNWSLNQLVTIPVPVPHGATPAITSTNTYHRTHNQWETNSPAVTMASYTHENEDYVVGTYTCTPAVRFSPAVLAEGAAETVGETPFDYGGGKQVLDMVINSEGVYATLDGMLGRPDDPWEGFGAVRVDLDRLTQDTELDENSMVLVGVGENINHPSANRARDLDGTYKMDMVDDDTLVLLQYAGLHLVDVIEP